MEPQGIVKAFRKVKRGQDVQSTTDGEPLKKTRPEDAKEQWLSGVTVYIIPAGIGKARTEIFQKQIAQNGGEVSLVFGPAVTHVVVDDGMDAERALRLLRLEVLPPSVCLLRSAWLSSCISQRRLLSTAAHALCTPGHLLPPEPPLPAPTAGDEGQCEIMRPELSGRPTMSPNASSLSPKAKGVAAQHPQAATESSEKHHASTAHLPNTDSGSESEDEGVSQRDLRALISGGERGAVDPDPCRAPGKSKWVCSLSSESKQLNHNQAITDKLKMLETAYTHQGDRWRAMGYSKAINALKSYHKPISTYQEACEIPGIGKRLAEKIWEILQTGHLRKLDHLGDSVSVLGTFANIWGAGVKTAQMWYQQGFRTLEDIKTKASLTRQQAIGLNHYHDFLNRMPREEATEIEKAVCDMARSINPGLIGLACGSFRRGKPTCGDVDILITHPDGHSHRGVFNKLLDGLRSEGFITDDLVSQENRNQVKYLGVCRLPGAGRRYRRLDIIVVPYAEFACALLYFTGSAHFNRSMRALAKTRDMSLSEHSLSCRVRRKGGAKVDAGISVPTPSEEAVFEKLGLVYREPRERDW